MATPKNKQLRRAVDVALHLLEPGLAGFKVVVEKYGLLNIAQRALQKLDDRSHLGLIVTAVTRSPAVPF